MTDKKTYQQVFKATSLFGGVQFVKILISVIRSKVVAILLGPSGMGIMGLLNSTLELVSNLTNMGLSTSAVRDISSVNASQNEEKISQTLSVFRILILLTALSGAILLIVFSGLLSQLTFGSNDYSFAFIWLSISIILNQLTNGKLVVLQGLRKLEFLAKANIAGSIFALIVSLPLYYFAGVKGIVPALIGSSFVTYLFAWFYSSKIKYKHVKVGILDSVSQGKNMIVMGFLVSLSTLLSVAASYVVRIFISRTGGLDDVGFYNAGFAIVENYVGLVFTAMATDYFPRLSAIQDDITQVIKTVTKQAIIALLILVPVIVIFIVFSGLLIELLYSDKFLTIESMTIWAILGMFFRAVSWSMGFILFARNDSRLFMTTAILFNSIFLINNIIGYKVGGLTGIGISFLINYVIHFVSLIIITRKRYGFRFEADLYKIMFFGGGLCFIAMGISFIDSSIFRYSSGIIVILITLLFSVNELNKRMGIIEIITKKLLKK
jgi:O-antigen/teichoic acid export membrane protein